MPRAMRSTHSTLLALLCLLLGGACTQTIPPSGVVPNDDDSAANDDDAADDDDAASASVLEVYPADSATDVALTTSIWVDFDAVTTGSIAVEDAGGAAVSGQSLFVSGERLVFFADSQLAAGTAYSATVTWASGTQTWSFTTGTPTPLSLDPAGNTYAWSIAEGSIVSPPAAAQFLPQATQVLLTEVTSTDAANSTLTMLAATAEEDGETQNICLPTAAIPAKGENPAVWTDPSFFAGPANIEQTIEFDAAGNQVSVDVVLEGVTFSGDFASSNGTDVDSIVNGTLSFWFDGRNIDLGLGDTCSLLGFIPGFSCTACPDEPSANQCIVVWVEDMEASLIPGLDLTARTQAEIDADTANCGG